MREAQVEVLEDVETYEIAVKKLDIACERYLHANFKVRKIQKA